VPSCESRSLSDARSKVRGSPAANASSTLGRAAAPRLFDRVTVADGPKRDQRVRPTRRKLVNRHDRGRAPGKSPRHPRDRGARSDDSILDLTIAATHTPHSIVSYRRAAPASAGRAHNARSACLLPGRKRHSVIASDRPLRRSRSRCGGGGQTGCGDQTSVQISSFCS
jgi:hypothetical protein